MDEHRIRITHTNGMNPWRAGCGESCTSGSEGGLGKPAGGNSGTAPQSDPYTEHKTREGTLYCCVVLDQFSRRVVGWAIDRRNEATLVNDALTMAASSRVTSATTILHSDHGSQFTSWSFTQNLKHHELLGSMGTIGDCFDNSPMESFWGSMQIELLNRKKWMTYVELATAMADYIVNFYNPLRRHSSLEYLTPDEFEALPSDNTQVRTLISVGQ